MSKKLRDHLRSNVVGYVAVFLALSMGTAYATHPGGADTISSADIINNEVRTQDIRDGNLNSSDLRTNSVISGKIADGEVRSADVLDESLTGADVAGGSLNAADIANDFGGDFNDQGQDAVNADRLAGVEEEDFVIANPSLSSNPENSLPGLRWRGFFLDTDETGDQLLLASRIAVENVGTGDQFRVCNPFTAGNPPEASVVWVGSTRTELDLAGAECSSNFTIPDDGDFRISGGRMQSWGVYSGNIENLYTILVLASS